MVEPAVIDALWAQIEPTVFITREQYVGELDGWDIEAVHIAGRLAFAVLSRGPEFHFASFGTGAPISLRMIRERLGPLIERHGYVTTRTPKAGADRQHRFNRLLGFKAVGEDEFFTTYRKDR